MVGVLVFKNRKSLRVHVPLLNWAVETLVMTLNHFKVKRLYRNPIEFSARLASALQAVEWKSSEGVVKDGKLWEFVGDSINYLGVKDRELVRKVLVAGLSVVTREDLLSDNISYILNNKRSKLEVKKLTLLVIDTLGLLFNLEDELESEYYQHLVYAFNKIVRILRDNDSKEKALTDSGEVLFRVYKLTKAYGYLKSRKSLSREQFYEKLKSILSTFSG